MVLRTGICWERVMAAYPPCKSCGGREDHPYGDPSPPLYFLWGARRGHWPHALTLCAR